MKRIEPPTEQNPTTQDSSQPIGEQPINEQPIENPQISGDPAPSLDGAPVKKKASAGTTALIIGLGVVAIAALLLIVLVVVPRLTRKKANTPIVSSSDIEQAIDNLIYVDNNMDASTSSADSSMFDNENSASTDVEAVTVPKMSGNLQFVSSDVSEYPTVKLYYSFEDSNAQPIILNSPTAHITEKLSDGSEIERTIKSVERLEGNQGISIDIVADKSGSMEYDLPQMQQIMSSFVSSLDYATGDQAELIAFDSYIMYMCTYTQDVNLLLNGISNMSTYGSTALYDALITGIYNAAGQSGARCVIGFTDGQDNESRATYTEVINLAQQKEVPLYIIGTADADTFELQQIAQSTGGYYWNINTIGDLSSILSQIYSEQKDLYCISYEADGSQDAYMTRTVSCTLSDDSYEALVAETVFTPSEVITQAAHASRYEVIQEDISWTEANNACIARGGHLVTITSQAEEDTVSALADAAGINYFWIGGYTSNRSGGDVYGHWITGEDFNQFVNWYPGEPSRDDKDGTPEFYLMQWKINDQWSWNDQRDDPQSDFEYFTGKMGYICEYED